MFFGGFSLQKTPRLQLNGEAGPDSDHLTCDLVLLIWLICLQNRLKRQREGVIEQKRATGSILSGQQEQNGIIKRILRARRIDREAEDTRCKMTSTKEVLGFRGRTRSAPTSVHIWVRIVANSPAPASGGGLPVHSSAWMHSSYLFFIENSGFFFHSLL